MNVIILDNYDSFTYNLDQYLRELGTRPRVYRNDAVSLDEIRSLDPDRIVISPGPGHPDDPAYFGVCRAVILDLGASVPILGVCLGHQGIIAAHGGRVIRARRVMHGKTSVVHHAGAGLLRGLPRPFRAMRYHSLVGDPTSLPESLVLTAWTRDGVIMGVQHRTQPTHGVQFHPESIGTPHGKALLANFLEDPSPSGPIENF